MIDERNYTGVDFNYLQQIVLVTHFTKPLHLLLGCETWHVILLLGRQSQKAVLHWLRKRRLGQELRPGQPWRCRRGASYVSGGRQSYNESIDAVVFLVKKRSSAKTH